MKDSEGREVRRKVKISLLAGISRKENKSSKSLLIHIYGGADEFFYTKNRDEIIGQIKKLFFEVKKKNLPIFAPAKSSIDDYCTSQEEAEKGLTRMPDRKNAIESENIYKETEDDTDVEVSFHTDLIFFFLGRS